MTPIQWLIDGLRAVQNQGSVLQISVVTAIAVALFLVAAWVKRTFRRGYQDIEDENDNLTAQVENLEEDLSKIHRENADLQREHETLEERLPEAVLSLVEKEISDGNHRVAMMKLEGMVDDLSPGLAACFSQLSEPPSASSSDDAERYRQLATLLRAPQEKAPPP